MKRIISEVVTPVADTSYDLIRVGVPTGKAYTLVELHCMTSNATQVQVFILVNGAETHEYNALTRTKCYTINDKLPEGTEVIVRVTAVGAGAGLTMVALVLDENE